MGKVTPSSQAIAKPKKKPPKSSDESKLGRSKNEKERRDAIAASINKLSDFNPFINRNSIFTGKKLETSIEDKLRMSASFYEYITNDRFVANQKDFKQPTKYLLSLFNKNRCVLNGTFFLCDGFTKFLFAHDEVFAGLGFQQSDLLGRKLTNILIPQEDRAEFEINLNRLKEDFWSKIRSVPRGERMKQRRDFSFTCRLQHNQKSGLTKIVHQNQPLTKISTVTMSGSLMLLAKQPQIQYNREHKGNKHIHLKMIEDLFLTDTQLGIFGQIKFESNEVQVFRHSIFTTEYNHYALFCDLYGKIVGSDQRISIVLGLLPSDVKGEVAHKYIHPEDLLVALFHHRELMLQKVGEVEAVYRLLINGSRLIYLKAFGRVYIEYRDNNPVFIVNNIQISEEDGKQLLDKQWARVGPQLENTTTEELTLQIAEQIKGVNRSTIDCDLDGLQVESANQSTSSYLSDKYLSETSNGNVSQSPTQKSPVDSTISLTPTQPPNKSHNLTHDQPVQSLFYQCFPVVGSEQMFAPLLLSNNQSSPRQLLNSTHNPVDHLFIQNININNIIMLSNQNQQHWDHQLPTEGEGAFVNLSPFLE